MGKRDSIESGSEEEEDGDEVRRAVALDYEKERIARIAENKARMEALGLGKMSSSLTTMMGSSSQVQRQSSKNKKSKAKVDKEDDDYRPEDERPPSSSGEEEEEGDEDEDYSNEDEDEDGNGDRKSSKKGKAKNQKKKKIITATKSKKIGSVRKVSSNSGYIDDDDEALKMAIALSLQESGVVEKSSDLVGANQSQGDSVKINKKRRKTFASRLQMTDDELILHFYQFDENWNGGISVRDLERVANQHDFTWTDKELADMIRCFDSDGDGKISIDDFRKIAMRCKMIIGSEES